MMGIPRNEHKMTVVPNSFRQPQTFSLDTDISRLHHNIPESPHNTTQIDLMPEDVAPSTAETDQVDDILDMFYVDDEGDGLDAMEQEDVDLYNLYGDGSATPYTRPSSPQDTSQVKDIPKRDGMSNDEDTSRFTYDNTEGGIDEKTKAEEDSHKEHEETTEQEDKVR